MTADTIPTATPQKIQPFPSIWVGLGWVILFFVLQAIVGIIAYAIAYYLKGDFDGGALGFVRLVGDVKFIALPTMWGLVASSLLTLYLYYLYVRKDDRISQLGLDRWSRFSLLKTLGIAVALIGTGLAFNAIYSTYIIPNVEIQAKLRELVAAIPKTGVNNALIFVAAALLAPILEELIFRGLLQNSLMHIMPSYAAIILSAAIFGAVHVDQYAFPTLMALGIAFGYLYHLTGSLRTCIALHAVNNATAFLLDLYSGS